MVLTAVRLKGMALRGASWALRDDELLVILAVQSHGDALQYASPRLCDKEHVVTAAIYNRGSAFDFASDRLRQVKRIAFLAATSGVFTLRALSAWSDDDDVMRAAVKANGRLISELSPRLQQSREHAFLAIQENEYVFPQLHAPFQEDKEIVLTALRVERADLAIVPILSEQMRNDPDVKKAIKKALRRTTSGCCGC
jgi:hypothetical protein